MRLFLFLFALFIPFSAAAQHCGTENLIKSLSAEDRARLDALVAPHAYATGNLWRAEKDGSTVTVVGTLHLPDNRHQPTMDAIRAPLENADLLIMEATSEAQKAVQTLTVTQPDLFFFTEGPTLIDHLTEEEWSRLQEELAEFGMPGFMAAKFKPWFIAMTLAMPTCAVKAIQSGEKGLDFLIEDVALANNVPIAELDEIEPLMKLLAGDPIEKQLDGLRIWLELQTDDDAAFTTMVEGYFEGRVREVWEYTRILLEQRGLENGEDLFEEINQQLLEARNRQWEPKIAELVAGQNVVLAVGAAHLSGESGVLRALERAGYRITPLE